VLEEVPGAACGNPQCRVFHEEHGPNMLAELPLSTGWSKQLPDGGYVAVATTTTALLFAIKGVPISTASQMTACPLLPSRFQV